MGREQVDAPRRRRLLVERHLLGGAGRSERSVADVAATLGLLHSTDPSTPYLSLHARSDAWVAEIDDAVYDERSLVRHTTIRRTIFLMPHDVADLAHGAANPPIVTKLRAQLERWLSSSDEIEGPAGAFLDRVESLVVTHLAAEGPATGNQLADAIPELRVRFDPAPGAAYSRPMRITSKVLEILGADRRIARARPAGADLTSGAWTWAEYDGWFGRQPAELDADIALDGLLARYLRTFAPATVTDMAWWTGLTKTGVRAALGRIGAREVALAGVVEPGYAGASDDLDPALVADRDGEPCVALLPGLDATTMGWKDRSWYVDDDVAAGLFDRNGNAGPTVWVDGRVAGAWTQRPDGDVTTAMVADVGRDVRAVVDDEARRVADWLGDVRVRWRYPTLLTKQLDG